MQEGMWTAELELGDFAFDRQTRRGIVAVLDRRLHTKGYGRAFLRSLPDAPETYYLMELMASHDFQTALQNSSNERPAALRKHAAIGSRTRMPR